MTSPAEIAKSVIGELHEEELEARDVDAPDDRMPAVRPVEEAQDDQSDLENAGTQSPPPEDEPAESPAGDDVAAQSDEETPDGEAAEETMSENDEVEAAQSDAPDETDDADADAEPAPEVAAPPDEPAVSDTPQELKSEPKGDGSVFDRLRAKRAGADDAPSPRAAADAPAEATLEDVANAIAKADAGELTQEPVSDNEADDASAVIAPLQGVQTTEWRRQVRHSIDETRGELKEAHASVSRLKKTLADMQRKRRERRDKIAAGMARAESLLNQVRKELS